MSREHLTMFIDGLLKIIFCAAQEIATVDLPIHKENWHLFGVVTTT